MALSDSPRRSVTMKSPRRRAADKTNKHWSDSQKIEVVTLWLSTGNLRLSAATLNIPEETVRVWRKTQWWKEIAEEIQLQDKIQFSATAQKIINQSMDVIADRLQGGDYIYDSKQGQLVRKPVSLRDATHAASTMMDKKVLLDKTEQIKDSAESVEQRLNKLMDRFAAMAKPSVTDVIYVENTHAPNEERQEGLLVRQEVRGEGGPSPQQGGEERSEEDDQ